MHGETLKNEKLCLAPTQQKEKNYGFLIFEAWCVFIGDERQKILK